MELGQRLRQARTKADMTQEQLAETLGCSRQTISNWETGRSYPDILSVIRLSDLYGLTLDELIKGDVNMVTHLEESTNAVKSKRRLTNAVLLGIYILIWVTAELCFWFVFDGSDAMAFGLIFIWVLLPVATFVISLLLSRADAFGRAKWLLALFFGVMFLLLPYTTYSTGNMIAFHVFRWPEFELFPIGAALSLAGLAIGALLRRRA